MHRREYLFLYDITYANPNGDPNDENRPRIDEESGRCLVTDVRLKRTVRDYLFEYENEEIFVREIENEDGSIQDAKQRAKDFLKESDIKNQTLAQIKETLADNILLNCIDVRLFGATIPLEFTINGKKQKSSITYTGPVQFNIGESLHRVKVEFIKGTGAFAAEKGKEQKTFREEWIIPYALIGFWGVANEIAAQKTKLSNQDLQKLQKALWEGTKNLLSRSKIGQMPRLLLEIHYKEGYHTFIGELNRLIKLQSDKEDEEIRDISDIVIDTTPLLEAIEKRAEAIEAIYYRLDKRVRLTQPFQSQKVAFKAL